MRHKQVRSVVLLGAISIIGIIAVQLYFLIQAWDIREKQFHQTVMIGLKNVAEKICTINQTALPSGNPVKQITSNYFVVDVNSVIDANILEFYLKTEFAKLNLHTDYEYAIYDCHTDKMVYGNYISVSGSGKPATLSFSLPKYDRYIYYFGVRFPALRNTLAGDMAIWFFFSAILLFSIIFFVYAMFVILRQKRWSELQKDFINTMTHEFKTPLSSINISADVIAQPNIVNDPERLLTYASVIKQENNRMIRQVEKVLQVAKIEKQGIELKKETLDLNSLVETVAETFRANAGEGVQIETSLDPGLVHLQADVLHMTNVLFNLLDNAVKYSGEKSHIMLITANGHKQVTMTVRDNGPGISPKYQKHVFEKFFRVPSGNIHDVKGFGLGLYYVKTVCRAHGWKIRLLSEPGHGAAFKIMIPLKK
ncbi:MAG: HAMP domain-containing sensor histidine kinase [Bacteroidota bacterium]